MRSDSCLCRTRGDLVTDTGCSCSQCFALRCSSGSAGCADNRLRCRYADAAASSDPLSDADSLCPCDSSGISFCPFCMHLLRPQRICSRHGRFLLPKQRCGRIAAPSYECPSDRNHCLFYGYGSGQASEPEEDSAAFLSGMCRCGGVFCIDRCAQFLSAVFYQSRLYHRHHCYPDCCPAVPVYRRRHMRCPDSLRCYAFR